MSPLVSYFIFASVIATSLSVLLVGLTKLKGLPLRAQTRLTGLWLTLHASALALGSGGPWLSNVLILGTAIGAATVLARTVRVPGTLATLAVTASVESRSWPWASCSWWRPPTVAPRPSCAAVEGPDRYLCLR